MPAYPRYWRTSGYQLKLERELTFAGYLALAVLCERGCRGRESALARAVRQHTGVAVEDLAHEVVLGEDLERRRNRAVVAVPCANHRRTHEAVVPEAGEGAGADEVALHAHPETVHKSAEGKRGDEDGDRSGDQLGLSVRHDDSEEQEREEAEEVSRTRMQAHGPVGNDTEDEGAGEEERQRDERVGDEERCGAVQPVPALADEHGALLEERGDAGNTHKGQESDGEEVHRQAVVDLAVRVTEANPNRREHQAHPEIHAHAHAVCQEVAGVVEDRAFAEHADDCNVVGQRLLLGLDVLGLVVLALDCPVSRFDLHLCGIQGFDYRCLVRTKVARH